MELDILSWSCYSNSVSPNYEYKLLKEIDEFMRLVRRVEKVI